MATLLELEDAIIDRLRALVPEANISELPLDPAEIGVPVSGTQIWVAFRQGKFDEPPEGGASNPLKPPGQKRQIFFELIIRNQELRVKGHQRIYPILDKIRDSLAGWMPNDIHRRNGITRPFYPTGEGFTSMGAGLWVYSQTYACRAIYTAPTRTII
jgi:Gp37 protein